MATPADIPNATVQSYMDSSYASVDKAVNSQYSPLCQQDGYAVYHAPVTATSCDYDHPTDIEAQT